MNSLFLALLVLGSPCSEVEVSATVHEHLGLVRGALRCHVGSAGPVDLVSYQHTLAVAERDAIDDVNRALLYPFGHQPGNEWIEYEGIRQSKRRVELGEHPKGAWLKVSFEHVIGGRTGLKGTMEGYSVLLAGWHPVFARGRGPVGVTPIRYEIEVAQGRVGMVGMRPVTRNGPRKMTGDWIGRYVPVVLGNELRVDLLDNTLVVRPMERRLKLTKRDDDGLHKLVHNDDPRVLGHLRDTLTLGRQFLTERLGLGESRPPLVVVFLPLRQKLIERFDGGFAVSDRLFSLPEAEKFMAFHRAVVWRHQIRQAVESSVGDFESVDGRALAPDFVASSARDVLVEEIYGRKQWASDFLDDFIVIPEIDALLHAPQIPFPEAYFRAIHEDIPAYVSPFRFESGWPSGKLLYEKLKDRTEFGPPFRLATSYLATKRPLWAFLAAHSEQLSRALSQWLRPYPKMDYELRTLTASSDEATFLVEQSIQRDGENSSILEPLTVRVFHGDDKVIDQTRLGPGKLHFENIEGFSHAILDPGRRLVELAHEPGFQARYNNMSEPRWLFMLNNIAGLVGVTAETLAVSGSFSLRRQYDQRNRYGFSLRHTPSAVGGTVGMSYGFGPERTAMGLSHHLRLNVGFHALRGEGMDLEPGREGFVALGYRHDTRLSPHYSLEGRGLQAHLLLGAGDRDLGEDFTYWRTGISGLYLARTGSQSALAFRLRVDYLAGDPPVQSQLRLGGLTHGARGFEASALRGSGLRAIASIEHRHVLFTHGRLRQLLGGVMWTRLEGAFFADAVHLPNHDGACSQETFYDVGYGLRFIGDVLSISPAMISLDFGFPVRSCSAMQERPMAVYLSFLQSFTTF